jgi:general secretion pathway protein E
LLEVTDELRAALGRGASARELGAIAARAGMRTLREHGEQLVREGVTSREEVMRVTREVDRNGG